MAFKPMSINLRRRQGGATLVELLMAIGVGGIVVAVLAAFSYFATLSLVRTMKYIEMAAASQSTIDQLTRDARRAGRVTSATATSLVLEDFDGVALTYAYDASQRTLTRTKNGTSTVLLKGCDVLTLTLGKRNPAGPFESFPAATAAECKVISVAWQCSRTILGNKTTTENLASSKIVIRRQGS
jgi:Tfp pilus assembly protein PilW